MDENRTAARWQEPHFLAEAHGWIDDRLAALGRTRDGDVEQPHVTPWSTVMKVPTDDGVVWFKANEAALAHEAAVLDLVAGRSAGRVPAPLAHDAATGWMLLTDAGERLRDVIPGERSLTRWVDVLGAYARVQLACEDDVETLVALGVPDRRLHTLPTAYADLLGQLDDVDPRLPGPEAVEELCRELAAYGIRETVQHDDLHDGQVFLGSGVQQVLDWGDACVSHPFFTLSVTLEGVIAWGLDDVQGSEDLAPYLAAYLAPYRERYDGDLDAAARLAMRLGWICRAVNGHLPHDPGSTHTRLRMFLDGAPPTTTDEERTVILQLHTDRLVLRPVTPADLDTLLSIRNAPGVVATTGTGKDLPRETMAGQLERRCASWREAGLGSWLVLLDGAPIAYVEVAPIGEDSGVDPNAIEVGVVVHPDHWGTGIAAEAGLAVARDLFQRVALDRVYAGVDPDNEKSLRALAKAPGVRKIDDELYELSADALLG